MITHRHTLGATGLLLVVMLALVVIGGCGDDNPVSPNPNNVTPTPLSCQITSATPSNGTAPLAVSFAATASGGTSPYTYQWRFGDGQSAQGKTVSHTYQSAGSFTARLIVSDGGGEADTGTVTISVAASNGLTCNATADKASGIAPLVVQFSGTAANGKAPYTYSWQFGDGATSNQQNPSHTFSSPGTFSVTLTATDADAKSSSDNLSITVTGSGLSSTASADKTTGQAPLTVHFTGGASGGTAPYSYSWVFGDGGTSGSQSPSHTYTTAGTYSAHLSVKDATGAKVTKTLVITVSGPSLACTASADKTSGTAPLAVNFTGGATGGVAPYSYSWTFGDGSSSTSQSPSHTYSAAGSYTATLTVKDAVNATATKSVSINVVNQMTGPVLSGPSTSTGNFTLTWTFTWPPLSATGEGFSVEQSTASASSGFSQITTITRGNPMTLVLNRAPGTYYFRVRAFVNQGVSPGWTEYSNVVKVTVTAPVSKTRFNNNSTYLIVSLKIDNIEQYPTSPQGLLPGYYYEVALSPGTHSYAVLYGFWNEYGSREYLYQTTGTFTQRTGVTEQINFTSPTISQLLTKFGTSGTWSAWVPGYINKVRFKFYANGTFTFTNLAGGTSTGTYSYVSRNGTAWTVTFSVAGYQGVLYEWMDYFVMYNGPGNSALQYFYDGP